LLFATEVIGVLKQSLIIVVCHSEELSIFERVRSALEDILSLPLELTICTAAIHRVGFLQPPNWRVLEVSVQRFIAVRGGKAS